MRCLGKVTEGEPAAQGQQWGERLEGKRWGMCVGTVTCHCCDTTFQGEDVRPGRRERRGQSQSWLPRLSACLVISSYKQQCSRSMRAFLGKIGI